MGFTKDIVFSMRVRTDIPLQNRFGVGRAVIVTRVRANDLDGLVLITSGRIMAMVHAADTTSPDMNREIEKLIFILPEAALTH
jgi:hypothetical protein